MANPIEESFQIGVAGSRVGHVLDLIESLRKDVTYLRIGELAGIKKSTISKLSSREIWPSAETLAMLELTASHLCRGETAPRPRACDFACDGYRSAMAYARYCPDQADGPPGRRPPGLDELFFLHRIEETYPQGIAGAARTDDPDIVDELDSRSRPWRLQVVDDLEQTIAHRDGAKLAQLCAKYRDWAGLLRGPWHRPSRSQVRAMHVVRTLFAAGLSRGEDNYGLLERSETISVVQGCLAAQGCERASARAGEWPSSSAVLLAWHADWFPAFISVVDSLPVYWSPVDDADCL
jgi:hypothetical protein